MRQTRPERHFEVALDCGFRFYDGNELEVGDLLVTCPGPAQLHLLVFGSNAGFIHAHAGLGKVVRTPAPCPWPFDHIWRLDAD